MINSLKHTNRTNKGDWLDLISLSYLYLPIAVFSLTWFKAYIGIPFILLCLVIIFRYVSGQNKETVINKNNILWLIISMIILFAWCVFSGLGGFAQQTDDWQKHNVLLKTFINHSWPINISYKGKSGVISYYIGDYLLPGLVGKISNFNVAQVCLLLWMFIGLVLLSILIYRWINTNHGWSFLIISFSLILFSTFIYPLSGIYKVWNPTDLSPVLGPVGEWFSNSVQIQYTSNISLLRYVFPQFVAIAIGTISFINNRYEYEKWGIWLAPLSLYSTFAFVGLALLMVLSFIYDSITSRKFISKIQKLFSFNNICALIIALILAIYIAGNILQPKPEFAKMSFSFINYSNHKLAFLTFQISWIIWVLLLLKYERKNSIIYISSILLFILPFCRFGFANDLVMRVSIPALLILNFAVIRGIVVHVTDNDKYPVFVLIGALLISGAGPLWEIKEGARTISIHQTYNMKYKDTTEYFNTERFTAYQYVDWDKSGIIKLIIRK